MARNRKAQSGNVRLWPALRVFILCLFFGSSGVGYVWQKNQILQLGRQMKAAELLLDRWRAENHRLSSQWNALRSPPFLELRIKELNLELSQPLPQQIVRLSEPELPQGGSIAGKTREEARSLGETATVP